MKPFFSSLKTSFIALLFLTVLLGVVYPLLIRGIGSLFFPREANGSLISQNGTIIGAESIAQNFTKPGYFHPRPSNAGAKGYDAASSSGSNLGPTSEKLRDALAQRASAYRTENNLSSDAPILADAVTSSASGLDPHIGVQNALLQARRVASARNLSEADVQKLIADHTEGPTWGLFGEERINVLRLNLALDQLILKKPQESALAPSKLNF